jgi:hypothetical protein
MSSQFKTHYIRLSQDIARVQGQSPMNSRKNTNMLAIYPQRISRINLRCVETPINQYTQEANRSSFLPVIDYRMMVLTTPATRKESLAHTPSFEGSLSWRCLSTAGLRPMPHEILKQIPTASSQALGNPNRRSVA